MPDETYAPLSQAELWQAQKDFFAEQGAAAWDGEVPFYITSNAYMAGAYAALLLAFLEDCRGPEPLYVLELGAGPGAFSYRLLRRLEELHELAGRPFSSVVYVMTDAAERNLEFWAQHAALKRFVELGVLDFARFDLEAPAPLQLKVSGRVLGEASAAAGTRLAVIANYVLDVTAQDLFRIRDGQLEEVLIRLPLALPPHGPGQRGLRLNAVPDGIVYHPAALPIYPQPTLNAVLAEYAAASGSFHCSLPVAALCSLEWLRAEVAPELLLLAADKGLTTLDADSDRVFSLGIDGRCVSALVNFDALARYARATGGSGHQVPSRGLVTAVYTLGFALDACPQLRLALAQHLETANPGALYDVQELVRRHPTLASLETLVALLRLTGWDPGLFHACLDPLLASLPHANTGAVAELVANLPRLVANLFPMPGEADVYFDAGILLQELKRHAEALVHYRWSAHFYGASDRLLYNMGLCHYELGEPDLAVEHFRKVLEVTPNYVSARGWLAQIEYERMPDATPSP